MQNKAIEGQQSSNNNNKEEELFNTHKELCEALNMDEATKEKSWQSYKSISYNYMLNVGISCFFVVNSQLINVFFVGQSKSLAMLLDFPRLPAIADENCGRSEFHGGRELCVSYAIVAYL